MSWCLGGEGDRENNTLLLVPKLSYEQSLTRGQEDTMQKLTQSELQLKL